MFFFPPDGFYHIFLGFLQVFPAYPGTLKFHDLTNIFSGIFSIQKIHQNGGIPSENPRVSRVAAGIPDAGTSQLLVENNGGPCTNGGFSMILSSPDLHS